MKIIPSEDFIHSVMLATPHNHRDVKRWLDEQSICYTFFTHIAPHYLPTKSPVEYKFANERDAALFALKWS